MRLVRAPKHICLHSLENRSGAKSGERRMPKCSGVIEADCWRTVHTSPVHTFSTPPLTFSSIPPDGNRRSPHNRASCRIQHTVLWPHRGIHLCPKLHSISETSLRSGRRTEQFRWWRADPRCRSRTDHSQRPEDTRYTS